MVYDLIVENGYILDGSGNPWFKGDIGVTDGKIRKIGSRLGKEAEVVLSASNLIVAPGFIDLHTHNELTLLINPEADKLKMGVTTEVVGTCGVSAAPVKRDRLDELRVAFCTVGGGYGFFFDDSAIGLNWTSFGEFINHLEKLRFSVNVGSYVGHLNLRIATSGLFNKLACIEEIEHMKLILEEAMSKGALGLSTALSYVNVETQEIIELCKVVSKYGGHYAQHDRDRSIDSTKEGLEIAEKSGVPLQLSHHAKLGNSADDLFLINSARGNGIDVLMDHWFIPYGGAGGALNRIPLWAREGGMRKVLQRLKEIKTRNKIREEVTEYIKSESHWRNTILRGINSSKYNELLNHDFIEISKILGKEPFDSLIDLFVEADGIMEIDSSPTFFDDRPPDLPEELITYLKNPLMMIASDSMLESNTSFMPDPRAYGVFPGVIEYYVCEKEYITMEDCVRKMTSLPAQRLGIRDRGLLREGMWADIVIFDKNKIKSMSVPGAPKNANRPAEGIKYVIVNGAVTIEDKEHTGAFNGRIIKLKN